MGQPTWKLLPLFGAFGSEALHRETLACLLQEMILRGFDAETDARTAQFLQSLRASDHPLGLLPPRLLPVERSVSAWLPRFRNAPAPPPVLPDHGPRITDAREPQRSFEPVTDAAREERIRASVADWMSESNGRAEVKLYRHAAPIRPDQVGTALLRGLGLASFGGATDDQVELRAATPDSAFAILFAASAGGGAYSLGRRGAYGRLDAWISFGGLAGIEAGSSAESIGERAERCAWFMFQADSGWFEDVAWDIGIVCLHPDGDEMAILAATDTD